MTQILRKNRAKNNSKICKISGNPARPAHKKLRALVDRELCIPHNVAESWPSQHCIQIRKRQTSSVGITQNLRATRAKELQSFRKFSARRAGMSHSAVWLSWWLARTYHWFFERAVTLVTYVGTYVFWWEAVTLVTFWGKKFADIANFCWIWGRFTLVLLI